MNPAPNLFLIGPMGAGKTSIGRRLARQLGLEFVDLDVEFEVRVGASIALTFEIEGEDGFRKRECELLAELVRRRGIVLSTGGGAVLDAHNRHLLRSNGFVVWLDTDVDTQLSRLHADRQRPLLQGPDRRQKLEHMAELRNPLYAETADLRISASGNESSAVTARHVGSQIARSWNNLETETPMIELEVALGERSYPIHIGKDILQDSATWRAAIGGRQVLVVSNSTVAPLYLQRIVAGLDGLDHCTVILEDGEQYKTFDNVARVLDALARLGASRDATVIALGGGVIGDLGGFAASCWMRGIDFVQMPTTLLAMVDSSVGGKTGVNLPAGKNLVGAFHQPRAVFIDTSTLATLPDREFIAGFAEVIKYGAIGDALFFAWLENHVDRLLARDLDALNEAIATSCRHKAGVVARDERELGERALLNFGHTFGHAIEVEAGYGEILHGEAVAIGMLLAARLSSTLGLAVADDGDRLAALLQRFGLPTRVPSGHSSGQLLERMRLDKKSVSGALRLILWRGIGNAEVIAGVDEALIEKCLKSS